MVTLMPNCEAKRSQFLFSKPDKGSQDESSKDDSPNVKMSHSPAIISQRPKDDFPTTLYDAQLRSKTLANLFREPEKGSHDESSKDDSPKVKLSQFPAMICQSNDGDVTFQANDGDVTFQSNDGDVTTDADATKADKISIQKESKDQDANISKSGKALISKIPKLEKASVENQTGGQKSGREDFAKKGNHQESVKKAKEDIEKKGTQRKSIKALYQKSSKRVPRKNEKPSKEYDIEEVPKKLNHKIDFKKRHPHGEASCAPQTVDSDFENEESKLPHKNRPRTHLAARPLGPRAFLRSNRWHPFLTCILICVLVIINLKSILAMSGMPPHPGPVREFGGKNAAFAKSEEDPKHIEPDPSTRFDTCCQAAASADSNATTNNLSKTGDAICTKSKSCKSSGSRSPKVEEDLLNNQSGPPSKCKSSGSRSPKVEEDLCSNQDGPPPICKSSGPSLPKFDEDLLNDQSGTPSGCNPSGPRTPKVEEGLLNETVEEEKPPIKKPKPKLAETFDGRRAEGDEGVEGRGGDGHRRAAPEPSSRGVLLPPRPRDGAVGSDRPEESLSVRVESFEDDNCHVHVGQGAVSEDGVGAKAYAENVAKSEVPNSISNYKLSLDSYQLEPRRELTPEQEATIATNRQVANHKAKQRRDQAVQHEKPNEHRMEGIVLTEKQIRKIEKSKAKAIRRAARAADAREVDKEIARIDKHIQEEEQKSHQLIEIYLTITSDEKPKQPITNVDLTKPEREQDPQWRDLPSKGQILVELINTTAAWKHRACLTERAASVTMLTEHSIPRNKLAKFLSYIRKEGKKPSVPLRCLEAMRWGA